MIQPVTYIKNNLTCTIRTAEVADAYKLTTVRAKVDEETEFLDRAPGEGVLDEQAFQRLIQNDRETGNHLFLVATVQDRIVGFSRCEGSPLSRKAHVVEFGVGVLEEYWGLGLGSALLQASIDWAEQTGLVKMSLSVLETNQKAVSLYKRYGFEVEGVLRKDKRLADGSYYDTLLMGRTFET